MYDFEQIKRIVSAKRKALLTKASFLFFPMIAALAVGIIFIGSELSFVCLIAVFPLVFLLFRLLQKSHASVILSKEIRGKNIKEYEYGIQGDGQPSVYRRGGLVMPHTYANRKERPLRLNGRVYLELDDGTVKAVSGLYKAHMDIYEDGDELLKLAGTAFPVIVSRYADRQPCPICGEVNDMKDNACKKCGISIWKQ